MKTNTIGHIKKGSSDKVYIVAIVDNKDGTYDVVGRDIEVVAEVEFLKEDVKARGVTLLSAETQAHLLIRSKMYRSRDPYVDIDSPDYCHGLTRRDPWLSKYLEPSRGAKAVTPAKPAPAAPVPTVDDEVVCVNNAGLEDQFDFGIEYICVSGSLSDDFVIVLDKYNERREVFSDRFMTVKKATAKGLFNEAASV